MSHRRLFAPGRVVAGCLFVLAVAFIVAPACAKVREIHAADGAIGYLEEDEPHRPNCILDEERARLEADWEVYEKALAKGTFAPVSAYTAGAPGMYKFWPQAGNLWRDLSLGNYTDLDPATDVRRDWNCGTRNYDGHKGYDVSILSFEEKDIGVPIFAVLDGRVTSRSDGNPDENTTWEGQSGNGVYIDHGGNYRVLYWHMKNGSPTQYVSVNQQVRAGQQIGLTASSGNSTWPHLHFESQYRRTTSYSWFEPATGPCHVGDSSWENQMAYSWPDLILRYLYVTDADLDARDNEGNYIYNVSKPYPIPKTGSFERGTRTFHVWFNIAAVPSGRSRRYRITDPDGIVRQLTSSTSQSSGTWRSKFTNFSFDKNGIWKLEYLLNNVPTVEHPIRIYEPGSTVSNQPPYGAGGLEFDPPSPLPTDVVFCRIAKGSYRAVKDPDSQVVGYVYRWKVNGAVVREGTWAAQSDAIRWGEVDYGDVLSCEVTPWDGEDYGPTSTISVNIETGPKPASLTVGAATAAQDTTFTLPVDLTGLRHETAFSSFQMDLRFDSSHLLYQRVLTGELTNGWGAYGEEHSAGIASVTGLLLPLGSPISNATGNLFNVEFRVRSDSPAGETYIVPENIVGELATFNVESGTVYVTLGSITPTPTPTITPTWTPTATPTGTPTHTRTPLPVASYDLNDDGKVDNLDLLIFIERYKETGRLLDPDFDNNLRIEALDLLRFSEHWREPVPTP